MEPEECSNLLSGSWFGNGQDRWQCMADVSGSSTTKSLRKLLTTPGQQHQPFKWNSWLPLKNKLGRGNRDKVQQFITITGASEKVALQSLKASDWHLDGAFDIFYSQPQAKSFTDTRHLEELYNRYKDPYADMIMAEGISTLCNDLQVDPQDIVMLVVSWHMKAATMCEFSKQEFVGGLQSLGIDSLEKFHERIPFMRSELKDDQKFKEIYIFAFGWAKEKGQKSLALDTAIGMWQLLFKEKQWPLVDHWCQFLQARHNKAISRDTWSQLLEFARVRSEAPIPDFCALSLCILAFINLHRICFITCV
ncbi:hypothetical protein SSX86_011008 [Deinandra increscens subsp. villosa]|uniref:Defective in cullin neddylation protein n=1 Tax=Deinandra increscens subsp. villosa TaxID=3103831 RepID=A0AAP0H332_9ASTR